MDDFASALGIKQDKSIFDTALEKEGLIGSPKEKFLRSLYEQESSSGKNTKTSNAGAVGGMQIIPKTFMNNADKDWDINNPEHNIRAGLRYGSKLFDMANGDPKIAAAGYYGGPDAMIKAQKNIAVRDPRNPNAPDTLQYANQVVNRLKSYEQDADFEKALFGKQEPIEENKPQKPSDQNKLNAFAAGFGGGISKGVGAIEQLVGKGVGLVAPETGKAIEQHALEQIKKTENITNPYKEANPITGAVGEVAGMIANPVNKLIPGFGGPAKTMLGGVTKGAAQGAIANALTTPVTDENKSFVTEKLKEGLVGGVAGGLVGGAAKAVTSLAQPFEKQLSKTSQENVEILRNAGVPVDVAQATGSEFLKRTKAALQDNPFTAGKEAEFIGNQQAAYNKAIAKTIGEDATAITPDVIQKAKNRLGDIYDDLYNKYGAKISGTVYKDLATVRDDALKTLPASEQTIIKNIVDDIINKASENRSVLTGQQFQAQKRLLDRLIAQNSNVSNYAQEVKDVLLSGLKNSIKSPEDIALLKQTNKQYGNMKKIEDVVLKDTQGNVSPSLLSNSLATKAKRNAIYAEDNELAKLARAGKDILQQKLPNSGTMARMLAQNPVFAGSRALYGKAVQKGINNPAIAQYLEQGVQNKPLRSLLELPKNLGKAVPVQPGVVGASSLNELINLRNQGQ